MRARMRCATSDDAAKRRAQRSAQHDIHITTSARDMRGEVRHTLWCSPPSHAYAFDAARHRPLDLPPITVLYAFIRHYLPPSPQHHIAFDYFCLISYEAFRHFRR